MNNQDYFFFIFNSLETIWKWIQSNLYSGGKNQKQMDLQFIQTEHRQGVNSIVQICGLSPQGAYQLYRKHGNNIENAINAHLNPFSPRRVVREIQGGVFLSAQSAFSDDDKQYGQAYQKYKNFVEKGTSFLKRYSLNEPNKRESNLQSQKSKIISKSLLIKQLEKRFGCLTSLRIHEKKIDQGLIWSWRQKHPLGLFLIDEQKESDQKLKQILPNHNLGKNCSDFFHLIALEIGKEKVKPWLTKFFFNTDIDANKLIIMRVNFIDEIQVVAKIPFELGVIQFQKEVNRVKSQCIHRQLDETQLVKQHALNRQGIKFRPQFFKQKMSKRQDARLRRAQNQAFFKAAIPIEKKQDDQIIKKRIPSQAQIKKQREQKRQGLVKYTDGLILKIRLPSGKSLQLTIGENEQINYIFHYIDSIDGQIGFQKDYPRIFDIIYGPSNINSLLNKKQDKVSDVLQPFQVLIVKEISDE